MPDRHDPDVVRAWVDASCAAQQLPVKVTDETVLAMVAGLLGAAPGLPGVPPTRRLPASTSPDHFESVGVEAVVATAGGGDGDVVEDGGDDRVLPGQRQ